MGGLGLALGGGGARGVYQLGVWRAFRELDLHFDAIAGTSAGAINAALMVGTDYERAVDMWENLQVEQLLDISQDQDLRSANLVSPKNVDILAKELFTQGSFNTAPLRSLLGKYLSEEAIRSSSVRYGLMTALLPELTPQPLWIDQIGSGQLIDYIIASAHYPGLQPVKIGDRRFIDGGLRENVPVSMLYKMGLRRIIAVDLRLRPCVRGPLYDNTQLTYIHDKQSLGGVMDLTPAVLKRNQQLGYLDTMKALDQLNGEFYAFKPADHHKLVSQYGMDNLSGLEQAALVYEMDRCIVYTADAFIEQISRRRNEVQNVYLQKRQALQIDNKLLAVLNGQLKILKLLPPLKLAFLMELMAFAQQSGYATKLPMQMFNNMDAAARALRMIPTD
ncbi:MAG: patatin-like phospholipase family protein [Ignavibacteriales bacterium]